MSPTREPLNLSHEDEATLLAELLESEQARLLVGIRHTFHRDYREELRRRLELVEGLIRRVGKTA